MIRTCCWVTQMSLALFMLSTTGSLQAEVLLPRIFSENGILQRGTKVPIWGTTNSDAEVVVSFANQVVKTKPKDSNWEVTLEPLAASSTGQELVVKQGDQTITRTNIVVGDVWLCGGQSNMEWPVNSSTGKDEAIASAANANLRLFTVKRQGAKQTQPDVGGGNWVEAGPKTIGGFSGVGYFFGKSLQSAIGVPVGLISSNVGGTTAERWMAREAIDKNADIKGMTAPQGKSDLYNAMIAPLAPFAVKGAIWYQGESNADRPYHYRHVLSAMIKNWRDNFRSGDFPFLIVELAPFTPIINEPVDQEWATVRESMQWIAKNMPNVATVSIVDVGDEKDIHPKQKQPVGERLARAARAMAYDEKITPAGPQFDSVNFEGNKAVIRFKNVGEGLEARNGELTGFTIAGEDKQFHRAKATIEGDTVVVTADEVASPKAVRLGWANFPVMNLWNKDGLPAHPFRTDDWPVLKQDAK